MARPEDVGIRLTAQDAGASQNIDRVGDAIGRVESRAGRASGPIAGLGRSFRSLGSGIVMGAGMAVWQQISSGLGSIQQGVIGMNATLETSTLQFEILMGDADRAAEHVRGLFDFAAKTPFETGPIIEASRIMQTFGGDALNTAENLTLFGDAAAATSRPIEEVGFWLSRAYADIEAGRPFGEAAMRLAEMGVVTPQVRNELEGLGEAFDDQIKAAEKAGDETLVTQLKQQRAAQMWGMLSGSLGRFDGAMLKLSETWTGLVSSVQDNLGILTASTFKPVFDTAKAGMADLLDWLSSPEAQAGAADFALWLGTVINPENLRTVIGGAADVFNAIPWSSIGQAAADFGGVFMELARNVPWDTLGQAMTLAGQATKVAIDAFNAMPEPLKAALIGAWGLNKLTGGAVTGLVGGGAKAVLGGGGGILGGGALARGGSPATPMFVSVVGGGLGPGGAGPAAAAGGAGRIAQGVRVLGSVALAAGSIAALAEVWASQRQMVQEAADDMRSKAEAGIPTLDRKATEDAIRLIDESMAGPINAIGLELLGGKEELIQTRADLVAHLADLERTTGAGDERTGARVDSMNAAVTASLGRQLEVLRAIRDRPFSLNVRIPREAATEGGEVRADGRVAFATGTWKVAKTGPATVHAGEMILRPDLAALVRGESWSRPAVGAGGAPVTLQVTNNFGPSSVRAREDIAAIGRETVLQARLLGSRTRPAAIGGEA